MVLGRKGRLAGYNRANSPTGLDYVSRPAGNEMNVDVEHRLSSGCTVIDAHIEARNGAILCLNVGLRVGQKAQDRVILRAG